MCKKLLEESQWSEGCEAETLLKAVDHSSWNKHQGGQKS